MDRPFRFAVQAGAPPKGRDWATYARHIEALGYGTLVTADHVVGDGLAPFPALAAAATATRELRVGTLVIDNDFRNPLLLAREAATVDVISNGRLELGLGAGWLRRDNDSLGLAYDPPAVRVQRLAEAVPLLKRLWTEDEVTHAGTHYRHASAHAGPRPVQRPHPPIMIAGGGDRILELAVGEADIVVVVPDDRAAALPGVAERFNWSVELADRSPFLLVGSLDEMRAQLLRTREAFGWSYFSVRGEFIDAFAPLARDLARGA